MAYEDKKPMGEKPKKPPMDLKVLGRVLSYVFKKYKLLFAVAMLCTVISSIASVYGISFLETLIKDYIEPLVAVVKAGGKADFTPLLFARSMLSSKGKNASEPSATPSMLERYARISSSVRGWGWVLKYFCQMPSAQTSSSLRLM